MRETDPNKMSNTEWGRWAEARIAELEKCGEHRQDIIEILEGRVEELEAELARTLESIDAGGARYKSIIKELQAENQRLREAAQAVVDSATPHYDRWVNGVTRVCINRLAALLGGGENG